MKTRKNLFILIILNLLLILFFSHVFNKKINEKKVENFGYFNIKLDAEVKKTSSINSTSGETYNIYKIANEDKNNLLKELAANKNVINKSYENIKNDELLEILKMFLDKENLNIKNKANNIYYIFYSNDNRLAFDLLLIYENKFVYFISTL